MLNWVVLPIVYFVVLRAYRASLIRDGERDIPAKIPGNVKQNEYVDGLRAYIKKAATTRAALWPFSPMMAPWRLDKR